MRYLKDPYYLNSKLIADKVNEREIHNKGFYELVELLKLNKESNIYEVGFDFGQRLLYLQENNISVYGGIEFDPVFGLYQKHANLFKQKWDIRFGQIDYWNPINREVVITNNFLDQFSKDDANTILQKLLSTSKKLYLNENLELDLPKQGNIYVVINERGDDIKKSSGRSVKKEIELPNIESFTNRFNKTEPTITDTKPE